MSLDYVISSAEVETVVDTSSVNEVIARKVEHQRSEGIDDPFYVVDLNDIVKKLAKWKALLPRVTPFYAIKCNSELAVVELLAQLGLSFDCASKNEIALVLKFGVTPDRIIYANTCKQPDMIRYAAKNGVDLMTFDNEEELKKMQRTFPHARLLLRILPPKAKHVFTELGNKFGCPLSGVRRLLQMCKELRLNVVGISFHVGFGCGEAAAFVAAVEMAAEAFRMAEEEGLRPNVLDIGGGFPGYPGCGITMEEIAAVLSPALDRHFPEERGVRIIAEPGTFFVASALHLVTQVIGRRTADVCPSDDGGKRTQVIEYYINDGNYGSFCRGFEGRRAPVPTIVGSKGAGDALLPSALFGPTCDGTDDIIRGFAMEEAQVGDWLLFPYMGHYTVSASSQFNGMPAAHLYYIRMADLESEFRLPADVPPASADVPIAVLRDEDAEEPTEERLKEAGGCCEDACTESLKNERCLRIAGAAVKTLA